MTLFKTWLMAGIISGMGTTVHAAELRRDGPVAAVHTNGKPAYVPEYQAIVEVLNQYIDGCKQAKSHIMKPAFSDKATIFSVDANGKLTGGAIQALFDAIDKPPFHPSPEAQSVIVKVDIVGTAASARIDSNDVSGFSFSDFFQLLKVDGKWMIISKIFHTHVAP
ncbi:nuclear transport factor 2 family protein [Duganella lactea]|nr:nuclear transport factor 2 family protein [Duganella lactea]